MSPVQQGLFLLCAISCVLAAPMPDPEDDLSVIGLRYESLLERTQSPSLRETKVIVESKTDRFEPGFLLTRWFLNRAGEKIYY